MIDLTSWQVAHVYGKFIRISFTLLRSRVKLFPDSIGIAISAYVIGHVDSFFLLGYTGRLRIYQWIHTSTQTTLLPIIHPRLKVFPLPRRCQRFRLGVDKSGRITKPTPGLVTRSTEQYVQQLEKSLTKLL